MTKDYKKGKAKQRQQSKKKNKKVKKYAITV